MHDRISRRIKVPSGATSAERITEEENRQPRPQHTPFISGVTGCEAVVGTQDLILDALSVVYE